MGEELENGMQLAYQFYRLALEEFATKDILKQKDACEKGFRAAMEALDTLLKSRGYFIEAGERGAHIVRSYALEELEVVDPDIRAISNSYSVFMDKFHGVCFYSNADPKKFESKLKDVGKFIERIEEMLGH